MSGGDKYWARARRVRDRNDREESINNAIATAVQNALSAQSEAVQAAVAQEREACAAIADEWVRHLAAREPQMGADEWIAKEIRARGETKDSGSSSRATERLPSPAPVR